MADNKGIFDTKIQHDDLSSKIVVGLERISEVFRVLLWEHAKSSGLSPIQIQLLIFIKYHPDNMCGVTYLAKEFNMAKPTISDAVKSLESKEYVIKSQDGSDNRSHVIKLSKKGKKVVTSVENFASPLKEKIDQFEDKEQVQLLDSIIRTIYSLNQSGIISVQRTCYACKFYDNSSKGHYCKLMKSVLQNSELRLDCPEFEASI